MPHAERKTHVEIAQLGHAYACPDSARRGGGRTTGTPPRRAANYRDHDRSADDGGYELKQETYAKAAAGNPRKLIQSCRANGP